MKTTSRFALTFYYEEFFAGVFRPYNPGLLGADTFALLLKGYKENRENGSVQDNPQNFITSKPEPFPTHGFEMLDIVDWEPQSWISELGRSDKWPEGDKFWYKITLRDGTINTDFYWRQDQDKIKQKSLHWWFIIGHRDGTEITGFCQKPNEDISLPDYNHAYDFEFNDEYCPGIQQWMLKKDKNYLRYIKNESLTLYEEEIEELRFKNPGHPFFELLRQEQQQQQHLEQLRRLLLKDYPQFRQEFLNFKEQHRDCLSLLTIIADEERNKQAQFALGCLYFEGDRSISVNKNQNKAVTYFGKAAKQGHQDALSKLTSIVDSKAEHEDALDALIELSEQSHGRATTFLQDVAGRGNKKAQYHLGYLYEKGLGVDEDDGLAAIYYRDAAVSQYQDAFVKLKHLAGDDKAGNTLAVDAKAQFVLAQLYLSEDEKHKRFHNPERGIALLKEAAIKGDYEAVILLSQKTEAYFKSVYESQQSEVGYSVGFFGLTGTKEVFFEMGVALMSIKDPKNPGAQDGDYALASQYLSPAFYAMGAEGPKTRAAGIARAGCFLGLLREFELAGGIRTSRRAKDEYYEPASNAGCGLASLLIGAAYQRGGFGNKRKEEANIWYEKARGQEIHSLDYVAIVRFLEYMSQREENTDDLQNRAKSILSILKNKLAFAFIEKTAKRNQIIKRSYPVKATVNYQRSNEDELSISVDEPLRVLRVEGNDWRYCENRAHRKGRVRAEHLILDTIKVEPICEDAISDKCFHQPSTTATIFKGKWGSKEVALKTFAGEARIKLFNAENDALTSLPEHRSIVRLYGFVKTNDSLSLVMEFMNLGSLRDYLKQKTSRPDVDTFFHLASQIGEGVEFLHANNLIHRDLKSPNILLHLTLGVIHVKLADFGFAVQSFNKDGQSTLEHRSIMDGKVVGTWQWMAPEILFFDSDIRRTPALAEALQIKAGQTKPHYNKATDIYALSIVFWEILTADMPFARRADFMQYVVEGGRPEIPKELSNSPIVALIQTMWSQRPKDSDVAKGRPSAYEVTRNLSELSANLTWLGGGNQGTTSQAGEVVNESGSSSSSAGLDGNRDYSSLM